MCSRTVWTHLSGAPREVRLTPSAHWTQTWKRVFLFKGSSCYKKAMPPHSSTLAWKIPWMEKPGRLQSMGSLRVRHDWATSLSLFTFMHWRKWQPTPVFLPGESQGWGSLVGCCPLGHTESDTAEVTAAAANTPKKTTNNLPWVGT